MEKEMLKRIQDGGFDCPCGAHHSAKLEKLIVRPGALEEIPALVKEYGGIDFVLNFISRQWNRF